MKPCLDSRRNHIFHVGTTKHMCCGALYFGFEYFVLHDAVVMTICQQRRAAAHLLCHQ